MPRYKAMAPTLQLHPPPDRRRDPNGTPACGRRNKIAA
jgi:hypothetical protein